MADTLTPSIDPVIGTAIEVPTQYWKAYSTSMDTFDRPPPPASPEEQQTDDTQAWQTTA